MTKFKISLLFVLLCTLALTCAFAVGAAAEETMEDVPVSVSEFEALESAVNDAAVANIRLTKDISVSRTLTVGEGRVLTLDLDGHTLLFDKETPITVEAGGTLTLTNGKVRITHTHLTETVKTYSVQSGGYTYTSFYDLNGNGTLDDKITVPAGEYDLSEFLTTYYKEDILRGGGTLPTEPIYHVNSTPFVVSAGALTIDGIEAERQTDGKVSMGGELIKVTDGSLTVQNTEIVTDGIDSLGNNNSTSIIRIQRSVSAPISFKMDNVLIEEGAATCRYMGVLGEQILRYNSKTGMTTQSAESIYAIVVNGSGYGLSAELNNVSIRAERSGVMFTASTLLEESREALHMTNCYITTGENRSDSNDYNLTFSARGTLILSGVYLTGSGNNALKLGSDQTVEINDCTIRANHLIRNFDATVSVTIRGGYLWGGLSKMTNEGARFYLEDRDCYVSNLDAYNAMLWKNAIHSANFLDMSGGITTEDGEDDGTYGANFVAGRRSGDLYYYYGSFESALYTANEGDTVYLFAESKGTKITSPVTVQTNGFGFSYVAENMRTVCSTGGRYVISTGNAEDLTAFEDAYASVTLTAAPGIKLYVPTSLEFVEAYFEGERVFDRSATVKIDGKEYYVIECILAPKDAYKPIAVNFGMDEDGDGDEDYQIGFTYSLSRYMTSLMSLAPHEKDSNYSYITDSQNLAYFLACYAVQMGIVYDGADTHGEEIRALNQYAAGLDTTFNFDGDRWTNPDVAFGTMSATYDGKHTTGYTFTAGSDFSGTVTIEMADGRSVSATFLTGKTALAEDHLTLGDLYIYDFLSDCTVTIVNSTDGTTKTARFNMNSYIASNKNEAMGALYYYAMMANSYAAIHQQSK